MRDTVDNFTKELARLKSDLLTQAARVQEVFTRAIESFFDGDKTKANEVIETDLIIDRADVELERASITLLTMGQTDEYAIRSILTIVKVNNELERIADCGVNISEAVLQSGDQEVHAPTTFQVMANSVIGMLRDTNAALADRDTRKAERVLKFDDTVDQFKKEILLNAERKVASGDFSVDFAFRIHTVVKSIERVADHCTNVCEQVIYLETGNIVRHPLSGWTDPAAPEEV